MVNNDLDSDVDLRLAMPFDRVKDLLWAFEEMDDIIRRYCEDVEFPHIKRTLGYEYMEIEYCGLTFEKASEPTKAKSSVLYASGEAPFQGDAVECVCDGPLRVGDTATVSRVANDAVFLKGRRAIRTYNPSHFKLVSRQSKPEVLLHYRMMGMREGETNWVAYTRKEFLTCLREWWTNR